MDLDATQPIPLYFQVKTLIMEQIGSGVYLPGDRLPTEHSICDKYGISRTPVHRALAELADEGIIIRKRRHGTVVNPHWLPAAAQVADLKILVASDEWVEYVEAAAPRDLPVNVVAVGYPNLHRHISRAVAEGQAPDLVLVDSVWVREFTEAGILAPLDDLAPAWISAEYADFVPRFEHLSRPYAVSAEANIAGLWYRRDILDTHRIEPPSTWADLRKVSQRLTEIAPKKRPLAMPIGTKAGETTTYCLIGLMATNGAHVTRGPLIALDSRETIQTLAFIKGLTEAGVLNLQAIAYEWDRAPELLATGHAVMSIGGTYEAPLIAEAAHLCLNELDEQFGFVPLPYGPRGGQATVVGGMAYAIPKQSKRPLDAMRVLRSLVEPESVTRLAYATGTLPGRRSVVEAIAKDLPLVKVTSELVDAAVVRPQIIPYNRVSIQLQLMVESVILGHMTPRVAAARTARHIGAITGLPLVDDSNGTGN